MDKYGYTLVLNDNANKPQQNCYYKRDLELMTGYQLREICQQEKIIQGVLSPLDKDDLIRIILRYRGADENLLIKTYNEQGYTALQNVVAKVHIHCETDIRPDCSAKIAVYEGLSINYYDGLTIKYQAKLAGTNALIVSARNTLCGILNIEAKGNDRDFLYLRKTADLPACEDQIKNYSLLCMNKANSEMLHRIYSGDYDYMPQHLIVYRVPLLDFTVKKPVTLTMPIAIDFGSTNTTAGVYLDSLYFERADLEPGGLGLLENDVNYAIFYDTTHDCHDTTLLPSVVGVLSISSSSEPEYLFGYDAIKLANSSYIDEGFCVFYDIKRWIVDYEKSEEIIDKQGRRAFVKRKDILRAYFRYIVETMKNRFKCQIQAVHISSPVKQKYLFQALFDEILPEYTVENDDVLDEGIAVLYNTISEMIAQKSAQENTTYKALIIDCGGGTTDLSSCSFRVKTQRVSYRIDIETAYENGDTDFGGNNLTFRILQLLKIRLFKALAPQEQQDAIPTISDLLSTFDLDIFRYVDEHGPRKIYEPFDAAYATAESFLPTKFRDWEKLSRTDYYKVKNNFYYLFHIAERIKKEFYNKIGTLRVGLSSEITSDPSATMLFVDKWKITVRQGQELVTVKEFPELYLSIFDIMLILRADIYGIVHKFMDELYASQALDEYTMIKLTGQSCKIDIFRDALKEFVPGKTIKFKRKSGDLSDDFELKMTCIDGALKYLKDKKYGFADVKITSRTPALPYIITAYTHTGQENVLIHGLQKDKTCGHISRNMDDLTLKLHLKDMNETLRYNFAYTCTLGEFHAAEYEQIEELYGVHIPQDDVDTIVDREVKFFVWTEPRRWGFLVLPVYRDGEILMLGRSQFFSFESDAWVENFFDGAK